MKKLVLLIISSVITFSTSFSQPCFPEGISFTTQNEIDNFPVDNPNCTEILGHVEIGLDVETDITNLLGLEQIVTIDGSLIIYNNNLLESTDGLNKLTSVGGNLFVGAMGGVELYGNEILESTNMNSLTNVGGELQILGNPELIVLGLSNLLEIGGDFTVWNNASMHNLSVLEQLISIGGVVNIGFNNSLTSLSGLESLISVSGSFTILVNPLLTDISSLENLSSINGFIKIQENNALESLVGLDNVESSSINGMFIINNQNLSQCAVNSFCEFLTTPTGEIEIFGNAYGCESQQQVIEACVAVDINEINTNIKFSIYPNPASSMLFIKNENRLPIEEISIYNQLGQKLLYINQPEKYIDIKKLQQGIYFMEIISDELKIKQKLIIK